MISRRSFLHCSLMAGGLVVVPKFGRWFQQFRPKPVIDLYQSYSVKFGDLPWGQREWVREDGVWRPADPATAYPEKGPLVTVSADEQRFDYNFAQRHETCYFNHILVTETEKDRAPLLRISNA